MERIYTLPDIPAAPDSACRSLLVRFLEYRDFSAIRPLFDLLEEQDRWKELDSLRKWVANTLNFYCRREEKSIPIGWWRGDADSIASEFWSDLFTLEGVTAFFSAFEVSAEEEIAPVAFGVPANQVWIAEGDIPAGSLVTMDYTTSTVRIHPTPQEQQ